ncbi:MAG: hypothetical protein O3A80_03465 [bacterium]|nr:hypothetical protein [bacterium]
MRLAGFGVLVVGAMILSLGRQDALKGSLCPEGGCPTDPPSCGDWIIDDGEACDDGNTSDFDDCASDYSGPPACPNPNIDSWWLVDEGEICGYTCKYNIATTDVRCLGDPGPMMCNIPEGSVTGTCEMNEEKCPGNRPEGIAGDECGQSCAFKDESGIWGYDYSFDCDKNSGLYCVEGTCIGGSCGDKIYDPATEECDDDNTSNTDSCTNECKWAVCGDGYVQSPNSNNEFEGCDDGNRLNGDGCDRYCRIEEGTQIAADANVIQFTGNVPGTTTSQFQQGYQQYGFVPGRSLGEGWPQYPNFQQLPYQLPLAQLRPIIQQQGPVGDTGPAAVAVIGAGAAVGWSWMRRKKRK